MPINYNYKFKCACCKKDFVTDTKNVGYCKPCYYKTIGWNKEYLPKAKKDK